MTCPLCGQRKARRRCPALGQEICPACCGSKRLIEIACPPDCVYLAAAREHPPAAVVRRHQQDVARLVAGIRDFNQWQSEFFLVVGKFLIGYRPEFHSLADEDAAQAAAAVAATLDTASRGVIYEHRPERLPAERLVTALKPLLQESRRLGPPTFDRDAAVVLRRVAELAQGPRDEAGASPRWFLDLLARVIVGNGEGARRLGGLGPFLRRDPALDSAVIARYTWGFGDRKN